VSETRLFLLPCLAQRACFSFEIRSLPGELARYLNDEAFRSRIPSEDAGGCPANGAQRGGCQFLKDSETVVLQLL
jgi:hypothetical protein